MQNQMQNIIYESGYDSEWLETNIFDDSIIASKAPLTWTIKWHKFYVFLNFPFCRKGTCYRWLFQEERKFILKSNKPIIASIKWVF